LAFIITLYHDAWSSECQIHSATFAQQRNRLTTHFSERIPVVKRHMTVHVTKNTGTNILHLVSNFLTISKFCDS